jgi:DNA primase
MMADIVSRLEGVRETGPDRWLACCPAHEDRRPSLSIRLLEDRWLLHCFAGCEALSVAQALGLSLSDLFKNHRHRGPSHRRIPASDALASLDQEVHVLATIAADFLDHRTIDEATWQRLATATRRIGDARAVCCPARRAV